MVPSIELIVQDTTAAVEALDDQDYEEVGFRASMVRDASLALALPDIHEAAIRLLMDIQHSTSPNPRRVCLGVLTLSDEVELVSAPRWRVLAR